MYDVKINLIPNASYKGSNMNQCKNIYDQLSGMMKTKLLDNIIFKEKCPKAYQILQRNRTNDDGFEILTKIIFGLSSQLGGISEDPQELVGKFNIIDNENITEFYHREIKNSNKITLQNDKTGQENIFIGRFKSLIYNNNEKYRIDINDKYQEWLKFRNNPTNFSNNKLSFTIQDFFI